MGKLGKKCVQKLPQSIKSAPSPKKVLADLIFFPTADPIFPEKALVLGLLPKNRQKSRFLTTGVKFVCSFFLINLAKGPIAFFAIYRGQRLKMKWSVGKLVIW